MAFLLLDFWWLHTQPIPECVIFSVNFLTPIILVFWTLLHITLLFLQFLIPEVNIALVNPH